MRILCLSAFHSRKMKKKEETEYQKLARDLSAIVVDDINDMLVEQYRLSKEMRGMEFTSPTQLQQERARNFLFKTTRPGPTNCSHRRPIYRRSRVVSVKEVIENGVKFLVITCGCGHFHRYLSACRHMYSLLDREPIGYEDVFPERCKSYEVKYCVDEDFKKKCDARTEELERHKGLVIRNMALEDIKINPG